VRGVVGDVVVVGILQDERQMAFNGDEHPIQAFATGAASLFFLPPVEPSVQELYWLNAFSVRDVVAVYSACQPSVHRRVLSYHPSAHV
jgi:hypothetical protein